MYCALCGETPGPGPLIVRELRDESRSGLARLARDLPAAAARARDRAGDKR